MPRFNYTQRRKIDKADIEIRIMGDANVYFTAHLDLVKYNFPLDAAVVVEAYRQATWMRFEFGTIGERIQPDSTCLSDFDVPDAILFRVKVIENSCHKKLLGLSKEIRPHQDDKSPQDKISILPIKPQDLKQKIWDIDFTPDGPHLLINDKLNNPKYITINPIFKSLVFPEIIKTIYARILLVENDVETEWCKNWIKFAINLPGTLPLPDISGEVEDNLMAREDWINEVSNAFSRHLNTLELFKKNWRE